MKTKIILDNKKIEKAAIHYYNYRHPTSQDAPSIVDGFRQGAKWAINEFLKNLWHQVNKEPEGYDEWILLHYNVGNYYLLTQVKEFKSWKGFVEKFPIDRWLYIDDLLPEEGSNQ